MYEREKESIYREMLRVRRDAAAYEAWALFRYADQYIGWMRRGIDREITKQRKQARDNDRGGEQC